MPRPRPHFLTTLAVIALSVAARAADSPADLVRRAVYNEVNQENSSHVMFKDERKTAHNWEIKLIVQTQDAVAGMLIEEGGHPLSPGRQQAEDARLNNYIRDPEQLAWKKRQEKDDAERTAKIVKALPDAFLYDWDGTVPGSATVGRPGVDLVRLKFRPNPKYDPPSREEQVLTGMSGHVLIDANANRIAEIEATLEKQVGFGWGILGHLDRGGHFLVQQADIQLPNVQQPNLPQAKVNHPDWEMTRIDSTFTGKILLFRSFVVQSSDVFTDFRPVPDNLTFAQGVELLHKELAAEAAAARPKPLAPDKANQNQKTCCGH